MNKKYIVKQNDLRDCGICCLESIIKYYDGFIPLEQLRLDTKTNNNGTTAYNLIKTAKKYGFNAIGKKNASLKEKDIILPAIAHIITPKGLNHFVVIYKITKQNVIIMDPAKGYSKMPHEEFENNWTNIILLFKPYNKIPLYKVKNNLKKLILFITSNQKNLIFKIILNNIIITILSIIISYYFKIIMSSLDNSYISSTIFLMIFFLILNILKIYFNYIKNNLSIYLNKNINLLVIPEFINHIFKLPLNVLATRTSGEILTRVRDMDNIKELFSEILVMLLLDLTLIICTAFFLFIISNELFFILCIISLLYLLIGIATSPAILKKLNENIDLETEFNSSLSEKIDNIETIKNLNIVEKTIDTIEKEYTNYQSNIFDYSSFSNILITIKSTISDIGLFIISSYGIYLISDNKLNLLTLITFNSLISYFLNPLMDFVDIIPKFNFIKLSVNKISEFMNIGKENTGNREKFYNGDIVFNSISYTYNDYNKIINNLSLTIPLYSHSVIKGSTGSGKSTLTKMLNHNIKDYEGTIEIKGINLKDYSLETLRENILYVSQREKIFNESILNNIVLDKKISKEELNEVLKITKVDEIINKKSMRLESILYDEGLNLSGGERQRIILARSILQKRKILILDESLSETDRKTETEILNAIDKYLPHTTIIYISHTNTNCFKNIIEMDKINDR